MFHNMNAVLEKKKKKKSTPSQNTRVTTEPGRKRNDNAG